MRAVQAGIGLSIIGLFLIIIDNAIYIPLVDRIEVAKAAGNPLPLTKWDQAVKFLGDNLNFSSVANFFLMLGGASIAIRIAFTDPLSDTFREQFEGSFSEINHSLNTHLANISGSITGQLPNTTEHVVSQYIRSGQPTSQWLHDRGIECLERKYGSHCNEDQSFLSFIDSSMLETWCTEDAKYWQDYNTQISLRKLTPNQTRMFSNQDNLLLWEENRTLVLYCPSGIGRHNQGTFVSTRIPQSILKNFLCFCDINLYINNIESFSLKTAISENIDHIVHQLIDTGLYVDGPITLQYHDENLGIKYENHIEIRNRATRIGYREISVVDPIHDDHFLLRLTRPAKNLDFTFNIDPHTNYKLIDHYMPATSYHRDPDRTVTTSPSPPEGSDGHILFACRDWVLPGLGVAVVWGKVGRSVDKP